MLNAFASFIRLSYRERPLVGIARSTVIANGSEAIPGNATVVDSADRDRHAQLVMPEVRRAAVPHEITRGAVILLAGI